MNEGADVNRKRSGFSSSTPILLIANLLTIVFFITGDSSIIQVLWIYWLQSVIIGVLNVARILSPEYEISSSAGSTNSRLAYYLVRYIFAGFFIIHYGLFNLAHAFFVYFFSRGDTLFNNGSTSFSATDRAVNIWVVIIAGLAFALHHILSYEEEKQRYHKEPRFVSMGRLMFAPYLRVAVMHITIIIGPIVALGLDARWIFVPFMILKTMVDLALHKRGTSHALPNNRSLSYHLDKIVDAQHNQDIK